MDKTEEWLKAKIEGYGYTWERNRLSFPHKTWAEWLQQYASEVNQEKCDSCFYSYHNKKAKEYRDVEDFYTNQEEDNE